MRDEEPTLEPTILPIFYAWMVLFFSEKKTPRNHCEQTCGFRGVPPPIVWSPKGVGLIAHLMAPFRPALLAGSWSLGFFQDGEVDRVVGGYPK